MNKIVRLGTAKTYGGRNYSVYARIEIKKGRLSICGVEGPLPSGNALGSCGQIAMHKPELISLAPGWTRKKLQRFWEVWGRWHLNDLRAGCEHQRALGWKYEEHHDPKTFQGDACPECGYEIGSAWLKEELPQEIIDFLESLPDTDKQPAWV